MDYQNKLKHLVLKTIEKYGIRNRKRTALLELDEYGTMFQTNTLVVFVNTVEQVVEVISMDSAFGASSLGELKYDNDLKAVFEIPEQPSQEDLLNKLLKEFK